MVRYDFYPNGELTLTYLKDLRGSEGESYLILHPQKTYMSVKYLKHIARADKRFFTGAGSKGLNDLDYSALTVTVYSFMPSERYYERELERYRRLRIRGIFRLSEGREREMVPIYLGYFTAVDEFSTFPSDLLKALAINSRRIDLSELYDILIAPGMMWDTKVKLQADEVDDTVRKVATFRAGVLLIPILIAEYSARRCEYELKEECFFGRVVFSSQLSDEAKWIMRQIYGFNPKEIQSLLVDIMLMNLREVDLPRSLIQIPEEYTKVELQD